MSRALEPPKDTVPPAVRRGMWALLGLCTTVVLLTQPFIALEAALSLPGWELNAPIADLAALGLVVGLPFLGLVRGRELRPPAVGAALAFAGIAALSAAWSPYGADALHWLVRKPIFLYLAYAVALPWALRGVPRRRLLTVLALTAGISLGTSVLRISVGLGTWWSAIDGLTPNHKTLAVWMAPWLAWLWTERRTPSGRAVLLLVVAAFVASFSKTAWIAAGVAGVWGLRTRSSATTTTTTTREPQGAPVVLQHPVRVEAAREPQGVPVVLRHPVRIGAAVALALVLALYLPVVLGSKTMLDAARSRHSLNMRVVWMVESAPFLGQGPGSSTWVEMVEFPHYRVNGVDAHGALQKVLAEEGLLGLLAWLAFTGGLLRAQWRAYRDDPTEARWAWLGVSVAFHVNLLLSTESFSQTHWIPLGIAWSQCMRRPPRPAGSPEEDRCAS